MRLTVTGEGDEGDVFATHPLNGATADNALGVGEQDDLEPHGGWVGGGSGVIIAETAIEAGQVAFVIDEVVEGVFEGDGEPLSLQVHGKKARAGVDGLVAGHGLGSIAWSMAGC